MDIKRLAYFVAVADELNFSRAAERLNIAQPPLSRQIAQLEQEIGANLFDRTRMQIRLTQAGEVMLERAKYILDLIDHTQSEVRRVAEGAEGYLRLGFVGTATYGVFPRIIRAYRAVYPDVTLSLSALNNADLQSALIRREIDIAVARPRIDDAEIRSELLFHEPLLLAAPESRGDDIIRLRDLKDEAFIIYPSRPRPSFADLVLDVCQRSGLRPKRLIPAQDYQAAISLVAVGVGVCIVPASVSESNRENVRFHTYEGHNPGTDLSICYRRDNRAPHLHRFLELSRSLHKRLEG